MRTLGRVVSIFGVLVLSGCSSGVGGGQEVSRAAHVDALPGGDLSPESHLTAQAESLQDLTQAIMRNATWRGAAVGAASGCAVALISQNAAANCAKSAIVGGAIGTIIGRAQGRKEAERRVNLVSRNDLAQSISRASARLGSMQKGLTSVLAAQQAELATLRKQRWDADITSDEYDARVAAILRSREQIATSLSLSAQQARAAQAQIRKAQDLGQDGLEWHLDATGELHDEAISARDRLSLL